MFDAIERIVDGCEGYNQTSMNDKFNILMGAHKEDLKPRKLVDMWFVSASYKKKQMYDLRVKSRKGVG